MRLTRLFAYLLVLAAAAGCSKHATEPPPVTTPPSPVLVATQPHARAASVLYDTEIWGQFDRALDPATVHTQSTFLKLDGQRIACTVAYDDPTRRVTIQPKTALLLQRTYTIEFTQTMKAAPAGADGDVQRAIERAGQTLGLGTTRLPSGAGHDAQMMAQLGPMGMIFVPSVGGVSHSPKELTHWEDCARGANVLLWTVLEMDRT